MMKIFSASNYFEDQYVLRRSLPSFMDHVAEWEFLSTDEKYPDATFEVIKYGEHPRQSFELFKSKSNAASKGTAIFIHGGFWRAMDRQQSRFMARPFLDNGYDCIICEYRLMPKFALGKLVDDIAAMLLCFKGLQKQHSLSDNLLLTGHSAGAHLAAFGLKQAVRDGFRYSRCGLIYFSGVFDIFSVSKTSIGDELNMSEADIMRWSISHGDANNNIQPIFVVGDDETDEFKRQSIIAAQQLGDHRKQTLMFAENANHLSLLTKFSQDSNFTSDVLGQLSHY